MADKLSRHYAEGRLDESEFKTRLDTAMSATTRGDLNGLFHDLPRAAQRAATPAAAAPPHLCLWSFLVAFLAIVAGATMPFYPLYHVPWLLFAIIGFVLWRRLGHPTGTTTAATTTTAGHDRYDARP